MSRTRETHPSDYDPRLRLQGTFKQNKFLLLYSLIYEIKIKYQDITFLTEEECLNADRNMRQELVIFNVHNIYQELGYDDPERCKDELQRTARFTIDNLSQINIR